MHFTWFSSAFLNFWIFRQIKEKDIISRAESILQNYWIIWYPFCISVLKIRRPKFFVIHLISIHSTWFSSFLSFFGNFLKLKKGEPSFLWVGVGGAGGGGGRNQFLRTTELFGCFFCFSILKIWRSQNLCHLLNFNVF